jgi:restriction endonuclease S subunit
MIGTVPADWRVVRLDECCEVRPGPSGGILDTSHHVIGGVPVVTAGDVGSAGIVVAPRVSVTADTAERLHRHRLRPGDIVLVRIGVTTRHAMVSSLQDGWLLGGSCIRFRAVDGVLPGYLACYLAHPAVQEWLAEHTHGTVLPTVTKRTVATLPLVLPPIAVQAGLVEVARIFDEKIRAHENVIQTTRALRDLLLPRLLAGDPALPDVFESPSP